MTGTGVQELQEEDASCWFESIDNEDQRAFDSEAFGTTPVVSADRTAVSREDGQYEAE
jgi:hypothetical protein